MSKNDTTVKQGRIIISRKGFFTVETAESAKCVCKACTRLRLEGIEPLCGDTALYEDNGDGTGFITDIAPRKNRLPRPSVANADMLLIVIAAAEPEPDLFYVDKMTCTGIAAGVETAVVINKTDIVDGEKYASIYRQCGFRVFMTRSDTASDIAELKSTIHGKFAVFAGPSGVGKSSLINAMYPDYCAETGELSTRIMRGKNTTRHTELFSTGGGYIADTPGFTALDFEYISEPSEKVGTAELSETEKLPSLFPEFSEYASECRFRDCSHTKETGCGVIAAVQDGKIPPSRHESYIKLFDILRRRKKYS